MTETNAAYRTADHERWQNLDFVVGIEIHLSGNHTCKGRDGKQHAFTDICDELAGKYPKDFMFTGWHPHCRCYATTILKTEEEMAADDEKILRGEPVSGESVNEVKDVPEGFKKWLKENEERAKTRFSIPDFFTDNINYIPKELIDSYASRMPYDTYAEYESAMKYNKKHSTLSEEQKANIRELNKTMPVIQGKIMNFSEADDSKCNPDYSLEDGKEKGFYHNCQTCTLTYELRRRGYKVKAKGNPILEGYKRIREMDKFYYNEADWTERFLNSDGSKADYNWSHSSNIEDTVETKKNFIVDKTTETGRYEVYCGWKKGGAHVFIIEKTEEGNLIWYDPQTGNKGNMIEKYVERMKTNSIGVLRIDDKIINTKYAKRLVKVRK